MNIETLTTFLQSLRKWDYLTITHVLLMLHLKQHRHNPEACRLVACAEACNVSGAATTGLADRLENLKILTRVDHPTDRRAITLRLTEKGMSMLSAIQ